MIREIQNIDRILLDLWEYLSLDSATEDLAKMLITIAKTTIVLFWGQKKLPILSTWKKKIWDYFILSNLEFSSSLKANFDNFVAVWYPILPSNTLYKDRLFLKFDSLSIDVKDQYIV